MIGKRDFNFIARVEMDEFAFYAHRIGDNVCQIVHRVRLVGTHIENLVARSRIIHRPGDYWSDVTYMGKCAFLSSVAENGEGLAPKQLIHENSNDVPVPVTNVLPLAIDVVRTENNVVQTEHFMTDAELLLNRKLRNTI